jgi:colicin import membrane protein
LAVRRLASVFGALRDNTGRVYAVTALIKARPISYNDLEEVCAIFHKGRKKVAGSGLIKSLAEREGALAKQLEEARTQAASRVQAAEAEAAKIAGEAEQAVRDMESKFRAQMADQVAKLEAEAKAKAASEAGAIANAAGPKVAGAVQEVLKEVIP